MKKIIIAACIIANLFVVTNVKAQWFEATGKAPLHNDDIDTARNNAVQNALKQALLFSGAQVKSIAQITDGLLTSDRFEVRSQGSVRNLQLIDETQFSDSISVTIRVDIVSTDTQCDRDMTVNTIALTQFPIRHRQQAVIGGIFDLGKQAASQLFTVMSNNQGSYKATILLNIDQPISTRNQPMAKRNTLSAVQTLAQHADTQYLLAGELTDISMHTPKSKWYGLSSHIPERQFTLALSLFDASDGERVWNKSYVTAGGWHFEKTQSVDVGSSEFWNTDYGMAIQRQLNIASSDINQHLYCSQLKGAVIAVTPDELTINLGKSHGVKVGDKFSVYHNRQFTDSQGITRQSLVLSTSTLIVIKSTNFHAIVSTQASELYGDININDTVLKQ